MPTTYKKIIKKLNLTKYANLLVIHQNDIGICHGSNQAFKKLCSYGFIVNIPRSWW